MRAVVLSEDRPQLELVELADPEPGPGEALIRVTGCGICGSDLHVATAVAPTGMTFGHEIAGTVEAVGPGVDTGTWAAGETVAVRPFTGCGHCAHCLRGRADHCDQFALLGLGRPGGFAELVVAQADEVYRLPASVTGVEQALVEPMAIACRAVRRGGLGPSDTVVVLGAGPIGLAIIAWARHLGVESIVVSDPSASRRVLAAQLGASRTFDPLVDELDLLEVTMTGASVVFECTGRKGLIRQAMDIAAVDGRVVVVGVCIEDDVTFPYTGLNKELDVRYALYYERDDFTDTIDVLSKHGLVLDGFVDGTVTLEELPAAFAGLLAGAEGGKLVVAP
ncbi:MAG TPA: alcohol dehydrogenase catalytic domain-containing protein [Acidimicrobiales bacterium]|nr:alcohol dehydrogenase catalytic domain-containing protein [Acidimicrobiales bacterium]